VASGGDAATQRGEVTMFRAVMALLTVCLLAQSDGAITGRVVTAQAPDNEETLRTIVLLANSDGLYSEAYRRLDPELLANAWAGEALLDLQEDISALRQTGQYLDLTLENIDFERILELGPGRARVVTVEYWLARLYRNDQTYVGYQRQIVENRYLVEQRNDRWYIIEADQTIRGGDPVFRQGEP
jgi:hypothetical protein